MTRHILGSVKGILRYKIINSTGDKIACLLASAANKIESFFSSQQPISVARQLIPYYQIIHLYK
jgi:hypothetical protein